MEKIQAIIDMIPMIIEMAGQVLLWLVTGATILARVIPPLQKIMPKVDKAGDLILRGVQQAPTMGVNPRTKALEKALEEARARLKELEQKPPQ